MFNAAFSTLPRPARALAWFRCSRFMHDARGIGVLAKPLILSQFAQTGILFIDTLLMGRLGAQALAGGALALSTFYLCYVLAFGLVAAAGNLVAIHHGAGRRRDVVAAVRAGLLLAAAASLGFGVLLWNIHPLMLWLGQDAHTALIARDFLRVLVWGMPFGLLFLALRSFAAGVGRPGPVPVITLSALAFSAIAGWALSQWLGVYGVALSAALTYGWMGLAFSAVVAWHPTFRRYPLFARFTRRDFAALGPLLRVGVPTSVTLGLESGLFNVGAWLMGALGAAQLAAHQSMIQLVIASFMVPLGLMYATSMRAGQAAGAGDWAQVRRYSRCGLWLAIGWSCVAALLLLAMPLPLIALFLPDGREGVDAARTAALALLLPAALMFVLDAWQALAGGMLRALKDARASMLIYAAGCAGFGLPLAWLLSRHGLGGAGVWWGMCAGLLLIGALSQYRLAGRIRALQAGARL